MKTPIIDFVKKYDESDTSRLHMPGHKGKRFLGFENLDITEIKGADSLYEADGIIRESEKNASRLFKSGDTFYSAEGSSLCIRSMIYAALLKAKRNKNERPKIAAVRNAHKTFIYACALLDIDVIWIYPENADSLCAGVVNCDEAEKILLKEKPFAFYLTSPDYLGEMTDIEKISRICDKYDVPLLVDNAHGAYLTFFDMHPINHGAAMCCDSAHKTLPSVTGGAYLHVSEKYKNIYSPCIKNAMSLFGSTSPSYLIMQSLDFCNDYIENNKNEYIKCRENTDDLKKYLENKGFALIGNEPLKVTVRTDGEKAAEVLRKYKVECEYADRMCIVLMLTPSNSKKDYERIKKAFDNISPYYEDIKVPPVKSEKVMSIRNAVMSDNIMVDVNEAVGKICATPVVSCPPAVPVAISGEIISQETVKVFLHYGIEKVLVVKNKNL